MRIQYHCPLISCQPVRDRITMAVASTVELLLGLIQCYEMVAATQIFILVPFSRPPNHQILVQVLDFFLNDTNEVNT
jgi:hypothetical protein